MFAHNEEFLFNIKDKRKQRKNNKYINLARKRIGENLPLWIGRLPSHFDFISHILFLNICSSFKMLQQMLLPSLKTTIG